MTDTRLDVAWLVCFSFLHLTHGFSAGAPDGVCQSMMPNHNSAPQQSPSPYKVTTSKSTIGPGEQIEISVSGNGNIKGFFIRARQGNNLMDIGDFHPNNIGQLRCNGKGITHNNNSPKDVVKVTWSAPANMAPGTFQFVATVVQEKALFWTMVTSSDITLGPAGGAPASPPATGMSTIPMLTGMMTTRGIVAAASTTPRNMGGTGGVSNTGFSSSQVGLTKTLIASVVCLMCAFKLLV